MHEAVGGKLTTLEAGRGLAALLVVLFHTTEILSDSKYFGQELFDGLFRIGHIGVDFFFVLSGFIILYVHRSEIGNASAVAGYLKKRLIRIYPAYWLVTALVVALMLIMPGMPVVDPLHLFKSMLLFPQQQAPLVGIGWTLIYEMFFYLLFALLMIRPKTGLLVMATLLVSVLVVHLIGVRLSDPKWSLSFSFLFNLHHLEFFMGMATAELVRRLDGMRFAWAILLAALLGFILLAVIDSSGYRYFPGFALCFAMTIYALVIYESGGGLRAPAWMVALGAASYSTYLVHYLVLSAVIKLLMASVGHVLPLEAAALLLVTAALAAGLLFHAMAERPLLRWLRRRYC